MNYKSEIETKLNENLSIAGNNVIARRNDEAIQNTILTGLLPASFLAVAMTGIYTKSNLQEILTSSKILKIKNLYK
jgi:hypothetical protein